MKKHRKYENNTYGVGRVSDTIEFLLLLKRQKEYMENYYRIPVEFGKDEKNAQ